MNHLIENHIQLKTILKTSNIADIVEEKDLKKLSNHVFEGLMDDENSWNDDMEKYDEIMDLALMVGGTKNFPWRGSANVKWPLIATAMVQFTSTSSPEFVKNGKVFDHRVEVADPDGTAERRGIRNAKYLNYKILKQHPNKFIDGTDSMLNQICVLGTSVKKVYVDPVLEEVVTESIPYDCITYNKGIKSFASAPRITEWFTLSMVEYLNLVNSDQFTPIYSDNMSDDDLNELERARVNLEKRSSNTYDDKANYLFITQFTYLDLDGDGYPEPYFVTANVDSKDIIRIDKAFKRKDVKRKNDKSVKYIKPMKRYIAYRFILSPDLSFPGIGFGNLLYSANKLINTLSNQIINAGTLATTQTGFYDKSLNLPTGEFPLDIGKMQEVDSFGGKAIGNSFHQMTFPAPDDTLFQMLGMVLEAGKDLTATTDALLGKADTQNASPDVIQQMVAQGKKVLIAVLRRILATAEEEASLIIELMAENVDVREYIRIVGIPPTIIENIPNPETGEPTPTEIPNPEFDEMFDMTPNSNGIPKGTFIDLKRANFEVVPVIDSNSTTKLEENFKYDAAINLAQQTGMTGLVDMTTLFRRKFKALGIEDSEKLVPDPQPEPPDPKLIDIQSKIDERGRTLDLKEREVKLKEAEIQLKVEKQVFDNEKTKAEIAKILDDIGRASSAEEMAPLKQRLEVMQMNANIAKTDKETKVLGEKDEEDTDK